MDIKERREALGLSQEQLAERLGVTQTSEHKWERGKAMPSTAKLPKLAELFHCTIDDLFRREAG